MKKKIVSLMLVGMLSTSPFAPVYAHAEELDNTETTTTVVEETAAEESVVEIVDEETPLAGDMELVEKSVEEEVVVEEATTEEVTVDAEETTETESDEKDIELEAEESKKELELADKELEDAAKEIECEHVDEDLDGACDLCGEEMELKEEAEKKAEIFNVTFVDGITGETIATYEVEKGADVTAPEAPAHEGYDFVAYSRELTNITEDVTITALYEKAVLVYEIDKVTDLSGRTYNTEGNYEPNQDLTVDINGSTQSYTSDDTAYYTVSIDETEDFVGTITFYENNEAIDRIVIHSEGTEVTDEFINSVRLEQVEIEAAPEKELETEEVEEKAEEVVIEDEETPLAGQSKEEADEDEDVESDTKSDDAKTEDEDEKSESIEIVADDKIKVEAVAEVVIPDTDGGDGDGDSDTDVEPAADETVVESVEE